MTVVGLDDADEDNDAPALCGWFDASATYKQKWFDETSLKAVPEAEVQAAVPVPSEPEEDNIKTQVIDIICQVSGSERQDVIDSDTLYDVGTIDSLDMVEIVMALEEEFEIEIPESEAENLVSLRGIVKFVQNAIK